MFQDDAFIHDGQIMNSLTGKIAVVTGAASGIGLGITKALVDEGASVAMLDIDAERLDEAARSIERTDRVASFQVDVSDLSDMMEVANKVLSRFGKVHILCNNAGVGVGGSIQGQDYALWRWCFDINVFGVVNGMECYLPAIVAQDEGGHIVNTSSILGLTTMAGQSIYSATKHALVGLSESARKDLAPHNIGVSVLCPAMIATNIIKSSRRKEIGSVKQSGTMSEEEVESIHDIYQREGLSAESVGIQVIHGIRKNKPYIFTHAEEAEWLRSEFDSVLSCFDGTEASE